MLEGERRRRKMGVSERDKERGRRRIRRREGEISKEAAGAALMRKVRERHKG